MRILTWHVHGAYLRSLLAVPHEWLVPVRPGRPPHFAGLPDDGPPWPANVREVEADAVGELDVDVVLFQHHHEWEQRHELLSEPQLTGPRVFVEHDPPLQGSPTDTRHPVDDPDVLLVHVTPYNALMWDSGPLDTVTIQHGVTDLGPLYTGELERGIAVVNNLARRGRRLGADVFEHAAAQVPLDLVGMGAPRELAPQDLPAFEARYRFFFNPIRYTSLGMAVCEAMMLGMPVVALATTEHAVAVRDGECGYVSSDVDELVERMRELLADRRLAARLGEAARTRALERYGLERFAAQWTAALERAARLTPAPARARSAAAPGWPAR
jgi:hypothetical protein